jgi:ubiquitin-protein ligase
MHEWKAVQRDRASMSADRQTEEEDEGGDSSSLTAVRLSPVKGSLYEWHFSFSGLPGSDYEGGVYHGRFLVPSNYPAAAPRVQMLTPNGRFATWRDICLSASSFHQESWSTHWSLYKLVLALRLHMLTPTAEIGGMDLDSCFSLLFFLLFPPTHINLVSCAYFT